MSNFITCVSERADHDITRRFILRRGSASAASILVVISPLAFRCHSRPSSVASARQNLWLRRARDLGPAAAAPQPRLVPENPDMPCPPPILSFYSRLPSPERASGVSFAVAAAATPHSLLAYL